MSEGDITQKNGEKPLEEFEIGAELNSIIEQHMLPPRIAQRIGEKLKEKNIKITKNQFLKLVEKIQIVLRTNAPLTSNQPEQQKKTGYDPLVQTTDMKKLAETIEHLNERLKVIEDNRIEGVKGVSGKLIKTKDIKTLQPAEILEDGIQPLEQIPSDPESIVVIMKWLQYLVDKTGKNNLPDILGYYVDINWISDDVRLDLIGYSKGITEEPAQTTTRSPHLPTRDHLQSLLFIQKLKGVHFDDRFLIKIELDMEKMAKSLQGYQLK